MSRNFEKKYVEIVLLSVPAFSIDGENAVHDIFTSYSCA